MATNRELLESLKKAGHRLTPQRVMVLSGIAEGDGHMGVDEILERVRQVYPYIDVATIYRTIHLLKRLHLVTEINVGGTSRYELTPPMGKHHHLVCQQCGATFDLSPSYLEELKNTLKRDFQFQPDLEHFTLAGLCSGCNVGQEQRKALP